MSGFLCALRLTQHPEAASGLAGAWQRPTESGIAKELDRMTRLRFSILASLLALASSASAQEAGYVDGGIVGPLPTAGLIPCFKFFDEPEFCHLTVSLKNIKYSAPFNVIDLNGGWVDAQGFTPWIKLYTDPSSPEGYNLNVDMALINRPDGIGRFVGEQRIEVYFPDAGTFTGDIEFNGRTIRWSNGTVWNKQ